MIGHVSMRSAQLWVQTELEAEVAAQYRARGLADWRRSSTVVTEEKSAFAAHIALESLEPGTTYEVQCLVNGELAGEPFDVTTQVLWDYRMDPPAFSFVTGSCAFINEAKYDRPGKPYGGGYEIFESMAADDPDMMLWLGDNIYLREVDFQSYSGFLHRYSHTRKTPEMAGLLRSVPTMPFGMTMTSVPTTATAVGCMPIGRANRSRRFGAIRAMVCLKRLAAFRRHSASSTWSSSCSTTERIG